MRGALSFLVGSYHFVEGGGDWVRRVFTRRREDALEAAVKEGAQFVCLLTLLE
jgi:hypothetical protein